MDTAEHMYTKCSQLNTDKDSAVIEILADLCFEIGRELLEKQNYPQAIRWLERANDALGEKDTEMSRSEVGDLKLSIRHGMGNISRSFKKY